MIRLLLWTFVALLWHGSGLAASFDCVRARTAHEKHICSNPDLSAADARLGDAYRVAAQSFPIRGFVQATERSFLLEYNSCDSIYAQPCTKEIAGRISILGTMVNPEAVYTDGIKGKPFDPENGAFWIAPSSKGPILHYFGGFMPDMNTPEPFPQGFICDGQMPLRRTATGYEGSAGDDTASIKDAKLNARIMCSARNSLIGDFTRVY